MKCIRVLITLKDGSAIKMVCDKIEDITRFGIKQLRVFNSQSSLTLEYRNISNISNW